MLSAGWDCGGLVSPPSPRGDVLPHVLFVILFGNGLVGEARSQDEIMLEDSGP